MVETNGNVFSLGEAFSFAISEHPDTILDVGITVVDPVTMKLVVGDGITKGGIPPKGKIWKVPSLNTASKRRFIVGDYLLVDDADYYYVGSDGVDKVLLRDGSSLMGWKTLTLNSGWRESNDAGGEPRVRKDGNLVTIDAMLGKDKKSEYSPFRLPSWARPNRLMCMVIECNYGYGTTPLVVYPDGWVYPWAIATRSCSRVSIQLSFWVEPS
ncbi:MAG: hypothetical protein CMO01_11935 [Thalassobius sp.]|nr:hypothetical protein [Thalassovita sp.]|tara:strand:- start:49635 stop:50270 length:636 start_codon:yes stop_codon:yes gene_type:complete